MSLDQTAADLPAGSSNYVQWTPMRHMRWRYKPRSRLEVVCRASIGRM